MSNNLALSQVAPNQANKETTINDATGQLDAALTEGMDVDLTSANYNFNANSTTQAAYKRNARFLVKNATVAGRTITALATKRLSLFSMHSTSTQNVSLVCGTTTLTLEIGKSYLVYTDGTANGIEAYELLASGGAVAPVPYDVGTSIIGKPNNGEIVLRYVFARATTFPVNLAGSQAKAGLAATASATFNVRKNGTNVGSFVFAASGTVATFTMASATSFAVGDVLEIVAPGTADASLADIAVTLAGTR